ncbi:ABC transporter ATP-binding protein, partial [Citrobacter youngae]
MNIISVQKITKFYKTYAKNNHRLLEWMSFGNKKYSNRINILNDISFNVGVGESVGILGMNGAGKSTLLKIITGTTMPSSGSVSVRGRVAALLELGMGFHPDFSGRDNVYMSGQLLGLNTEQIKEL